MKKINIIHLSDIHYDGSEKTEDILRELEKDLIKQKSDLDEYHLLLITGDSIDRGKVTLFDDFGRKVNKIIKNCGISKKKVIVAIGNHDANLQNPWLTSLLENAQKNHQTNAEIINSIKGRMDALYPEYNKFDQQYKVTQNGVGAFDISFKSANNVPIMRIRFIILNSSWTTTIKNGYGELVVGDDQFAYVKNEIAKSKGKKPDFTILCMHHPLDWFTYEERVKLEEFMEKCNVDFFLHGHIHTSEVKTMSGVDKTTNSFCTGISYQKTGENGSHKSGMRYSIYQIDKDTKTMNIYIRSTNEKGVFVEDNTLYSNVRNGFFTVPLENSFKCLMPFTSVEKNPRMYAVLTKENVEKILSKEELLFKFYCRMSEKINNDFAKGSPAYNAEYKEYKNDWLKSRNLTKLTKKTKQECEHDFAYEQFGQFCYEILLNLNSLFFHGKVRFLIRIYNTRSKEHEAFVADGPNSINIKEITNFKWKVGLIYQSFKKQAALLQSANMKYFKKGKTDNWINCLTMVVDGITMSEKNESIPLLSLNIAIQSEEDEACLEALAMSSIYDKVGAIFELYDRKVYKIKKIIVREEEG